MTPHLSDFLLHPDRFFAELAAGPDEYRAPLFIVGTGVIAVYTTSTPSVGFSANTTSGNAPLTVSFTSTSTGHPDMWLWDFGDGANSTEQNPSHAYPVAGNYSIMFSRNNRCDEPTYNVL